MNTLEIKLGSFIFTLNRYFLRVNKVEGMYSYCLFHPLGFFKKLIRCCNGKRHSRLPFVYLDFYYYEV